MVVQGDWNFDSPGERNFYFDGRHAETTNDSNQLHEDVHIDPASKLLRRFLGTILEHAQTSATRYDQ
eukprot:2036847-Karenia_brevis.AAC.1